MLANTSSSAAQEALARTLDHDGVLQLWQDIKTGRAPAEWGGQGKALEYMLIRAFQLELPPSDTVWPYSVSWPKLKLGTVEQIDGVVYTPFGSFLIEAKDEMVPEDVEPIAKLRMRLEGRPPGTMGIVVSTSGFSIPARMQAQFAVPLNILLWSAADLDAVLPSKKLLIGLRSKFRMAVERRVPDHDLRAEYEP